MSRLLAVAADPALTPHPASSGAVLTPVPTQAAPVRDWLDGMKQDVVEQSPYERRRFDAVAFWEMGLWKTRERLIVGAKTMTDTVRQEKLLDDSVWPVVPAEVARLYLRRITEQQPVAGHMRGGRIQWSRDTLKLLNICPPTMFDQRTEGADLAYVDISAAYFQLYSTATLDLSFRPGQTLGVGRCRFLDADLLGRNKAVRNTLVGCTRTTSLRMLERGQMKQVPAHNRFLAPELWGYLQFTLHAVAAEVLERFDVQYLNTDGFIVPGDQADALVSFLADEWCLTADVRKRGRGRVEGPKSYAVADQGVGVRQPRAQAQRNLLAIPPEEIAQLKRWRLWLAENPSLRLAQAPTIAPVLPLRRPQLRRLRPLTEEAAAPRPPRMLRPPTTVMST